MKMKCLFLIPIFLFLAINVWGDNTSHKLHYFDLQDVELLNSPFKRAQDLDKKYLLEMDADRLLAPFLREAGLTPKAESYTNWENTGLDGHIGGHYLSALSLMYASTGDNQIKQRLDYMLSELKRVQDANRDGYIGGVPGGKAMWKEISDGNIRAGGFDLNGKWVPLYNIHKTYAGLRDAWVYAQSEQAKEMLIKMTDWMIRLITNLSEEQMQDMLRSEHGGLNETFADVSAITGDEKYLKLAHRFSHQRVLEPLLKNEDHLTGMHANTQIPKVIGFKRIADLEGKNDWSEAARFFWETVVENRSVCIGGNSANEHFHPADDFSRMINSVEGPETCNTYNMMRLSKMFYQTSLNEKYVDYYERALYNHILSTQHPETGGLVYFTQMRPGHYRVYSQPHTSMWCCVGSGIENHAKYGEMIYAHTNEELFVNLFIPSKLNWKEKNLELVQKTDFPNKSVSELTINPKQNTDFTLKIRCPKWMEKGKMKVRVNGKEESSEDENYISIKRNWKKGDKVTIEMPMSVHVEQLPDKSNYFSFMYGPIVLAAKTNAEDLKGLFADDSRGGHIAHGKQIPLKDMPILVGEPAELASLLQPVKGKHLTFKLNALFPEKYNKGLELIPFYNLHESRYIIYFPQATESEVKILQAQIEAEERLQIKLDNRTIDKVVCGEQQPESDHFVKSENSTTGHSENIHWREAKGWFSYQLKNTNKESRKLYLKYFNQGRGNKCHIFINDVKVSELQVSGGNNSLEVVEFFIPESELQKEVLEVKFVALQGQTTPRIVKVRVAKDVDYDMSAYLLIYFKDDTHGLYMAVSRDGYSFTDVNKGEPVIAGDTIAEQKGIRDPHIMRGPDGYFYLAMTDLHIFAQQKGLRETEWERDGKEFGWGNNHGFVLMKSKDLINWTRTNLRIDKAFPGWEHIGCAWAPELIYDENAGKIMLYFTMRFGNGLNRLYYTYMNDDFTNITEEPKLLFQYPKHNKNYIDADITQVGNKYHMFYVAHDDGGAGIKQAVSNSIHSGYVYDPKWYDPEPKACEAPNVWKRIGENKWVLMYDIYGIKPHNFGFSETSDFVHFNNLGRFNEGEMKSTNFSSPKHGAVIHLTAEEANRLAKHWKLEMKF